MRYDMNNSIRLSPKYGLNPAMTTCFWCEKKTGVALLGRIGGKEHEDYEAPKYVFGGYEPCDECKEKMAMGVTLMEAFTYPLVDGQPEMQKGVWPSGRMIVITKEAAKEIFDNDEIDKAFVDKELFDHLTSPIHTS